MMYLPRKVISRYAFSANRYVLSDIFLGFILFCRMKKTM